MSVCGATGPRLANQSSFAASWPKIAAARGAVSYGAIAAA